MSAEMANKKDNLLQIVDYIETLKNIHRIIIIFYTLLLT